jgi:hypothetical protein
VSLEESFAEERLGPLHHDHTQQHCGHQEGKQEMKLQAQAYIPKLKSLLQLGLILLADPGSMGCNVRRAVHQHLNIPWRAFGLWAYK